MDQLLATGEQVSIALMALALQGMGIASVSLTGGQCGIRTDGAHSRARISGIDPRRVVHEFERMRVPVVAGFQGVYRDPSGMVEDVTTLGRGGSDTTAVALAAALGNAECEIYTDVDGVYTADPRVVEDARLLEKISYEEMMEAASQGAKVMHLRAVELGRKAGVAIRVLHSMRHGPGTLICDVRESMETQQAVTTVALKTDIGRVTIAGLPNRAGIQRDIFDKIAGARISVDDIIQADTEGQGGPTCGIVFTVDKTDLAEVRALVEGVVAAIGQGSVHEDLGLAKVSAVGVGMQSQPGVAAQMFQALAEAGIRIANITTSEIKISCLVDEADGKAGLRAVHAAFNLGTAVVPSRNGSIAATV
jgi:aspartate kinase